MWKQFSILSQEDLERDFNTNFSTGLDTKNIRGRVQKYGLNISVKKNKFVLLKNTLEQLKSPVIYILIIGAILTFILGEVTDTIIITGILVLNILIGLYQQGRANKAFEKLQKGEKRKVLVKRNNETVEIPIEKLLPGDVLTLGSGDYVPGDIRLFKTNNLKVDQSSLTGEWAPVEKESVTLTRDREFNEQVNMLWKGTLVLSGEGSGVVVSTGMNTRFGLISSLLQGEKSRSPLQDKVASLAKFIVIIIIITVLAIFLIGILRGMPLSELVFVSVAIAVAAMPEGLPAAITIVLSIGAENILKKGGLVKRLLAAETLGATTWIITDKTGTLTEGKLSMSSVIDIDGLESNIDNLNSKAINALEIGLHTSTAKSIMKDGKEMLSGDPVEVEILRNSNNLKIKKGEILDRIPFDSVNSFSASLQEGNILFTGSPELLLENQSNLTKKQKDSVESILNKKTLEGSRIIAVGYKESKLEKFNKEERGNVKGLLKNLNFVGLFVFGDSVRENVLDAIKFIKKAKINLTLATGDNPNTARYIAQKIGIAKDDEEVILGNDVENMNDNELAEKAKKHKVFARMLPEHKLRLSKVLTNINNEYVAMTGDGVNDAPTLRISSIGIALGTGTDVAKEASDMVLTNNNFSTITETIKEGRKIIDNLKKIIGYLLATSFGEVFLVGGALIIGSALPLVPAQILWANIVEEMFIVFAFAFEKLNKKSLTRDPKKKENQEIITPGLKKMIYLVSINTGILLIIIFLLLNFFATTLTIEEIRTIMFVAISIDSIFFSLSFKDFYTNIWHINIFSNKVLIFAIFMSTLFLVLAFVIEPLRNLLQLELVGWWLIPFSILIGFINLVIIELIKVRIFK